MGADHDHYNSHGILPSNDRPYRDYFINFQGQPGLDTARLQEIYDYLRLLYARAGKQYCYKCRGQVEKQTVQNIIDTIMKFKKGTKIYVMSPLIKGRKGQFKELFKSIASQGFVRVRINNKE